MTSHDVIMDLRGRMAGDIIGQQDIVDKLILPQYSGHWCIVYASL